MLSLLVGIGGAHPQRSCPQGRGWAWDSPSLLPAGARCLPLGPVARSSSGAGGDGRCPWAALAAAGGHRQPRPAAPVCSHPAPPWGVLRTQPVLRPAPRRSGVSLQGQGSAVAPARGSGSAGGTFGPIPTKGTQTSGK